MLRKNGALAKAVSVAQNYELQMEDPMTTFCIQQHQYDSRIQNLQITLPIYDGQKVQR